ncbi:TauD/TfdA family dioxygenase [Iamia majanohamensis]|uniref:TauD/TfdA family dioxygenase n=1 Tax=Iamia majanohamensis TaxID=467976 RepID=A0AAF0BR65_9ACTN|nr:TauD/TfdA family dioxygenase [Iamia majanohamensis]WCO66096.1 TauD/TfdA family dioxygenase [Iamia majanohamensis]
MKVEVLAPVGARVGGCDLATADAGTVEHLRSLLAEHGVLVCPGQHLGDGALVALLRRFGELAFTTGETPVPGTPELNVVTTVGRTTPPRSSFHVDTTYVRHPPAYTALRAVTVPVAGGATLFSDQRRALATLPPDLRARIAGRTVTHVVTGLDLPEGAERAATHPLVRPHPRTGRPALYLTSPARCASVSGLDADEGARLVAALHAHSTRPDNVTSHRWSAGDLVIWDNACVMHRADHGDVRGDRTLHRGMVAASGHRASPEGTPGREQPGPDAQNENAFSF